MTMDKHGRCVHYLVFRKRITYFHGNRIQVKWELFRELDTVKGHVGAFVRQNNESFQVRTIKH